ncbi:unnamed protein product, partial [Cyprideis torosa]
MPGPSSGSALQAGDAIKLGDSILSKFLPYLPVIWQLRDTDLRERDEQKYDSNVQSLAAQFEVSKMAPSFVVFCRLRFLLLQEWQRRRQEVQRTEDSLRPDSIKQDAGAENPPADVSQTLILGLQTVFQLISESAKYPEFCSRVLDSLLDVLNGVAPEAFQQEPIVILDRLFYQLISLSSSYSTATSALFALSVAIGTPGHILATVSHTLRNDGETSERITLPPNMVSLQRSLLGNQSTWFSSGFNSATCVLSQFRIPVETVMYSLSSSSSPLFAVWGDALFLLTEERGLVKVGSGFGGSTMGEPSASRCNVQRTDVSWMGCIKGHILLKQLSDVDEVEVYLILDMETLKVQGTVTVQGTGTGSSATAFCSPFTDGLSLGRIRVLESASSPLTLVQLWDFEEIPSPDPLVEPSFRLVDRGMGEVPLRLWKKWFDVYGPPDALPPLVKPAEEVVALPGPETDVGEPVQIVCGRDFALCRTTTHRLFVAGDPAALGVKPSGAQGSVRPGMLADWEELRLPSYGRGGEADRTSITGIAAAHDGTHALIALGDGTAYIAGAAHRGEDGEPPTRNRRIFARPVIPRAMVRIQSQHVVAVAANHGSSAFLTSEGRVLLFGKDAKGNPYVSENGLLSTLRTVFIKAIALGKAHAAVVSDHGHVYTFGYNNKGQCGRKKKGPPLPGLIPSPAARKTAERQTSTSGQGTSEAFTSGQRRSEASTSGQGGAAGANKTTNSFVYPRPSGIRHLFYDSMINPGQCRICPICCECTGFAEKCIAKDESGRLPGGFCGCGLGDSGCRGCGICLLCGAMNPDCRVVREFSHVFREGRAPHQMKDPNFAKAWKNTHELGAGACGSRVPLPGLSVMGVKKLPTLPERTTEEAGASDSPRG